MEEVIQGYPEVNLSVTNPNVRRENALDRNRPFTFLEFMENVRESYDPADLQNFYNEYIRRYNIKKTSKEASDKEIIIERYREFLRDITLNYTTNAEKKFLSQIDFADKYDLQIAISFYSRKIRSIISYYQVKRDKLHFSTTKAKLKGSNFGFKQNAYNLITDFLANRSTAAQDYNIDTIKENVTVSLTEFVDQYTQYFNAEPNDKVYGENYREYNPEGAPSSNIFLTNDTVLVEEVFFGIDSVIKELKEVDQLFENKRSQTEKFIGADYYYLSSNNVGAFEIGTLFEADAPYANFLNTNYPSVASVFSNEIKSVRDQGFFKPTNASIVSIESERLSFFSKSFYGTNKLYIFPDPNLFTNNDEIFTFIIDTSRSISNQSKGAAVNQPNTDKNSTSLMGYNSELPTGKNINSDLSFLFNQGYIHDSKKDLNGNVFGLLKDQNYYRNNFKVADRKVIKSLILNGYQFYDTLYGEGFSFNYDTTDTATYSETRRSGITSYTQGFTAGTVAEQASGYDIFGRYYDDQPLMPIPTFSAVDIEQVGTIDANVKEGAFFKFSDEQILDDAVSTNLSSYSTSTGEFFFSDLLEAGISYYDDKSTIVRALCDTLHPTATGDFTYNVVASGDNNVTNMEAGLFFDDLTFDYRPRGFESTDYVDETLRQTVVTDVVSAAESFFSKQVNCGKIYVKNINKPSNWPNVKELTETLTYLDTKYSSTIKHELSTCVKNFDLFYNTLFIETSSFLVVENIDYNIKTYEFDNYGSISNVLSTNTNNFDKISNRFKVGEDVYYAKLVHTGVINANTVFKDFSVYPEIYKFNYTTKKVEQIYPTAETPVAYDALYFNSMKNDVVILESSKPVLTYSSDNELFNLSFILKDQNKAPRLYSYIFEYKNKVKFINTEYYIANDTSQTFNFIKTSGWGTPEMDLSFLEFALSSGIPTLSISFPPSAASIIL
tara:strand:- start:1388 stop:4231 length:2844 start_codon:yes stop_codon:yes gene_type:complete